MYDIVENPPPRRKAGLLIKPSMLYPFTHVDTFRRDPGATHILSCSIFPTQNPGLSGLARWFRVYRVWFWVVSGFWAYFELFELEPLHVSQYPPNISADYSIVLTGIMVCFCIGA